MERNVWTVVKLLATSRKVWVAIIGAVASFILYAQGVIDAEKLASALVALAMAVIAAIAFEDGAEKLGANSQVISGELEDFNPRCCVCGEPADYVAEGPRWYCEEHKTWDSISVTVSTLHD